MTNDTLVNKGNLEPANNKNMEVFMLSRDPKKAMQEMMETIDSLRSVYVEENEALTEMDTQKFLLLQGRKIEVTRDYQAGVHQLVERKEEFVEFSPLIKAELQEKQEEFSAVASENLKALSIVRNAVERLNDRIMDKAREAAQKDSVNYKPDGALLKNDRRVSIGVSESA